ncbi:hypothetical protein CDD83_10821 [Cordyceps sp. RAO-2017]|nr:hypothetical protein CDD83_10821 [Cordyceps sp. RAO-2017]
MLPAARVAARRRFSVMKSMRSVARAMEPHPFQRLPASQPTARPDWATGLKRAGSQALIFFPGIAVLLGWPLAAKALVDGHV